MAAGINYKQMSLDKETKARPLESEPASNCLDSKTKELKLATENQLDRLCP